METMFWNPENMKLKENTREANVFRQKNKLKSEQNERSGRQKHRANDRGSRKTRRTRKSKTPAKQRVFNLFHGPEVQKHQENKRFS